MLITFTPTPDEKHQYEFKPGKLMSVEAELVEKKVGKPYGQIVDDVLQGSALARRAVVYVFEKRTHPTLSWEAFDFPFDAVEVQFDTDELATLRAAMEDAPLDDAERAAVLAQIDAMVPVEPAPKAPEPSDEPAT